MDSNSNCPECATPLSDHLLGRLCPKCLLKVALGEPEEEFEGIVVSTQTGFLEQTRESPKQAQEDNGPGETDKTTSRGTNSDREQTPPENETTHVAENLSHDGIHLNLNAAYQGNLQFSVQREFARGGLGRVLLAKDTLLNREVAIKEILVGRSASRTVADRFLHEARLTSQLEHPGIVPVHCMGAKQDGSPFYAMKLVRGRSLRDKIREFHRPDRVEGKLELNDLLNILVNVCNAIAFAHSRGVIHRDLKPHNVMVGEFGESIVIDWGLAKVYHRGGLDSTAFETPATTETSMENVLIAADPTSRTSVGSVVGTLAYMAPEQARGQLNLGPACDVFALGGILYEILVGKPPYIGTDQLQVLAHVQACEFPVPSSINAGISKSLEAICLKAMAADPSSRYATGRDMARDIARWLADEETTAFPDPVWKRCQRWIRRHRTLCVSVSASFLVFAVAFGAFAVRDQNRLEHLRQRVVSLLRDGQQQFQDQDLRQSTESLASAKELASGDSRLAELESTVDGFLHQVESTLLNQRKLDEAQTMLNEFRQCRDEAFFNGTVFASLSQEQNTEESLEVLSQALDYFQITNVGSPFSFLTEEQKTEVRDSLDELRFAMAEAESLNQSRELALPELRDRASLALATLEQILPAHQHSRAYHLLRAKLLRQTGDMPKSQEEARIAESFTPTTAFDFFLIGKQLFSNEDYESAKEAFESALRIEPDRTNAQYFAALCALEQQQWREAIVRFTACEMKTSTFIGVYLLRAFAHGELKELHLAEQDYQRAKAIADTPNLRFALLLNRGVTYLRHDKLEQATVELKEAASLFPNDPGPLINLAEICRQQGRLEESRVFLEKAIQLRPSQSVSHRMLSTLLRESGDLAAALASIEKAIALDQHRSRTLAKDLLERGTILHQLQRFEEAKRDFLAALKLYPALTQGHLLLAQSCFELGEDREAILQFDEYLMSQQSSTGSQNIKHDPDTLAMVYRDRGLAKHRGGDLPGAISDYARAIEALEKTKKEPASGADKSLFALMRMRHGWAMVNDGASLAKQDFDYAIDVDNNNAEALVGRAYANVVTGNIDLAIEDAKQAEALFLNTDKRHLFNVACVYSQASTRILTDITEVTQTQARDYCGHAIELFDQAVSAFPAEVRSKVFWQLQKDRALDPIRQSEVFVVLTKKYAKEGTMNPGPANETNDVPNE